MIRFRAYVVICNGCTCLLLYLGDLVKELKSADVEKSTAAIEKADAFLQADKPTGFDRTLVNTNSEPNGSADYSVCSIREFNL